MTDVKTTEKANKKPKSVDDEIAALREKLRILQDRKTEQERKAKEKNQKAVAELIKAERLDLVSAEKWEEMMQKIKKLLLGEQPKAVGKDPVVPENVKIPDAVQAS